LLALLGFFLLFGWLIWSIAAIVVAIMIGLRRHRLNQVGLLHLLAMAAKANVPLGTALEAYSHDCSSGYGRRVRQLASLLAQGRPLDEALSRVRRLLPAEHRVAARIGTQTGQLGDALREAAAAQTALEPIRQAVEVHAVYAFLIFWTLLGIGSFLLERLLPAFRRIFQEFDLTTPAATLVTDVSLWAEDWGWFWLLSILFAWCVCAVMWKLVKPLLIIRRLDAAFVLRTLAFCTSCGAPIKTGVRILADVHPRRRLRRRARRLMNRLADGAHWLDGLRRCRLIRKAEAAVLRTVADPAHLAWTMRELAGSAERRHLYRRQMFVQIAMPLCLVVLGAGVFAMVLMFMLPLIEMIQWMT
jgi:type II secretory pathway component PulF